MENTTEIIYDNMSGKDHSILFWFRKNEKRIYYSTRNGHFDIDEAEDWLRRNIYVVKEE